MADMMNNHFATVETKLASEAPAPNMPHWSSDQMGAAGNFELQQIDMLEMSKLLHDLKPSKEWG